ATLREGHEGGASERAGGGAFAGAGRAEEQEREVLHAIPEVALVAADVFGEERVPEIFTETTRRGAGAGERLAEETPRAAELPEELERAGDAGFGEAAVDEVCADEAGLRKGLRAGGPRLAREEVVEGLGEAVEGLEEGGVFEQARIFRLE